MRDSGYPLPQLLFTGTSVGTSTLYPMSRGPASFQASIVASGTGTSAFGGAAVVYASNDKTGWVPVGTASATSQIAAAGTSTGTATGMFFTGASFPFSYTKVIVTTLTTGQSASMNVSMAQ